MGYRVDLVLSRLLNQFQDSTKFKSLIQAHLDVRDSVNDRLEDLLFYRWIDTAEGVWLDIVGAIVGINRPFVPVDSDLIFTFKGPGDPDVDSKAFSSELAMDGGIFTNANGSLTGTRVSDDVYRVFVKAKALVTNMIPSIPNVYTFIKTIFDKETIVTSSAPGSLEIEPIDPLSQYEKNIIIDMAPIDAIDQIIFIS